MAMMNLMPGLSAGGAAGTGALHPAVQAMIANEAMGN